jgi:hypothetical protein
LDQPWKGFLSAALKEEEVASAWCWLDEERSTGAVTEELRLDGLEVCATMLRVQLSVRLDVQANWKFVSVAREK